MNKQGVEIDLKIPSTRVYGQRIEYIKPKNGRIKYYLSPKRIDIIKLEEMLKEDGIILQNQYKPKSGSQNIYYINLTFQDLKNIVKKYSKKSKQLVKKPKNNNKGNK